MFVGGIVSGFCACATEEFNEQRSNKETKSLDYDCFTPNFFVRGGGGERREASAINVCHRAVEMRGVHFMMGQNMYYCAPV